MYNEGISQTGDVLDLLCCTESLANRVHGLTTKKLRSVKAAKQLKFILTITLKVLAEIEKEVRSKVAEIEA